MAQQTIRYTIDNPHFSYFLRGHPGLRLREDVERSHSVCIQMLHNSDEIVMERRTGAAAGAAEQAMEDLRQGWYEDDFAKETGDRIDRRSNGWHFRAKEILELEETTEWSEQFNVDSKHVSSLIGHYGRRVAGLETRSSAHIKIDCEGNIATFGTKEACGRARELIEEWIRREGGGGGGWDPADRPDDDFIDPIEIGRGEGAGEKMAGPCVVTFWVPSRGAALIIGRRGTNVADFEKQYRCLIDLRTQEETGDGLVPVDITAKQGRVALDAKDAVLRFLDRFFPHRDWNQDLRINGVSSANMGSRGSGSGVSRLTFSVPEEHAPRLIGTRGNNKKRLEEKCSCILILRTEEKRNNSFPVDVIARTPEDCDRAQTKILAFLSERPTTTSPPPKKKGDEMDGETGTEEEAMGAKDVMGLMNQRQMDVFNPMCAPTAGAPTTPDDFVTRCMQLTAPMGPPSTPVHGQSQVLMAPTKLPPLTPFPLPLPRAIASPNHASPYFSQVVGSSLMNREPRKFQAARSLEYNSVKDLAMDPQQMMTTTRTLSNEEDDTDTAMNCSFLERLALEAIGGEDGGSERSPKESESEAK